MGASQMGVCDHWIGFCHVTRQNRRVADPPVVFEFFEMFDIDYWSLSTLSSCGPAVAIPQGLMPCQRQVHKKEAGGGAE
jgi:hypothetical protein